MILARTHGHLYNYRSDPLAVWDTPEPHWLPRSYDGFAVLLDITAPGRTLLRM